MSKRAIRAAVKRREINSDTAAMLAFFENNPKYRRDWKHTNKKVWGFAVVNGTPDGYRAYVGKNGDLYVGKSIATKSVDNGTMREIYIRAGNEILNKELNA